jgi:RimJ/RimL family protein N-acetyltransferase
MTLAAVQLEGQFVRLEPLEHRHCAGLRDAIVDGELWQLHVTLVPHMDDVPQFIANAHDAYAKGVELAFATVDKSTGRIAGSTRFMRLEPAHRRGEIGFTFLAKSLQRTRINTEAKLLMLTHAFEQLGFNRVEFLTDVLNTASRAAITRLGVTQEGILRNHMVMRDGRVRDSVVYSIIRSEWPNIKQRLMARVVA